ncbi:MAG: sodium/solute symporter [Saprospiraceae bacterium]|nr:sodium/solute symporter [Bacteroidia bacterium]NNE16422.1 sodium/solute symporter [Saprospiraceae bacterium]NNL92614.1 sodium/solute symporter [Saprospiraceae bacterium]
MNFSNTDLGIFVVYLVAMMGIGIWISVRNKSKNTKDYFLADKSLPWWVIGGSLIASNISAEQMIGMSGSGFVIGMAIATYELMAAATLLVVAKFLLPLFLKHNISTMPQFLEQRYDGRVRTGLAIFWLMLFVFVNITSLLFLGSLAINSILGVPIFWSVIGLAIYASTFSIFGGLRAVVWTDVIQVVVLLFGGILATITILNALSDGGGFIEGLKMLYEKAPEKFDMIFSKDATFTNIETGEKESAYALLPGIGVLVGGMWIANLYYWGFNQYIIQRALAAKNIREAQKGLLFASFLKVFMPFVVVLPGIAAYVMGAELEKADQAFPWVVNNYVDTGLKGIVVAALVAAIGSSLSSIVNSTSTIYTLDIHKRIFNKEASEMSLVKTGRIVAAVSLIIGIIMTPALQSFDQVFQFIQEYTGFISPAILAVFILGLFWKRTTTEAALAAIFVAIPLSLGMKSMFAEMPFLDRMGYIFLILSGLMIVISLFGKTDKGLDNERSLFKTSAAFNFGSLIVVALLAAIYALFW